MAFRARFSQPIIHDLSAVIRMADKQRSSALHWWNRQPVAVRVAIISLIGTVVTAAGVVLAAQLQSVAHEEAQTEGVACAVTGPTDRDTLVALIDAEAYAVLTEDLNRIASIFTADATVYNGASGEEWSALAYYEQKFSNEIHCSVEHLAYTVRVQGDHARVTSASRGEWGWEEEGKCTLTYDNLPGSDEWYLGKDQNGCWRIERFVFNAQSQP